MRRILLPVDGSAGADRAAKHVIGMLKTRADAEAHLLHVQPPLALRDVPDIAMPGLVERLSLD